MKRINCNHANGNVYQGSGFTIFEDTQELYPRYYGWVGTWDDHDTAEHFDYSSLEDAENDLGESVILLMESQQ